MPTNYSQMNNGAWAKRQIRETIDYDAVANETIGLLISFFRWYPDLMEEILCGERPDYHNSLINSVIKRYMVRYAVSFTFGSRGIGKTSCVMSVQADKGILWPQEITAYYGPSDKQAATLASKAFAIYSRNVPTLAQHWIKNSDSVERFILSTPLGSKFLTAIPRGVDTSGVVAEECAQTDGNSTFNFDDFNQIVLGTNRLQHMINGRPDPTHIDNPIHYITSCNSREHESYAVYRRTRQKMMNGESAYAVSIPWQVPVLCRMKSVSYYRMLKDGQTAEQFMRECESKCTGYAENPIIRDTVLEEASTLMVMEEKHNGDPKAWYVIGYDVSSRDVSGNALTAMAVLRCTAQTATIDNGHYRKSLVYVTDSPPPNTAQDHARLIKKAWREYSLDVGLATYIVIDARQYGQSVVEALHEDLGDGNPPFSTVTHEEPYIQLEKPGAVPCIYPIQATGNVGNDPNREMIDYMEREFENGNIHILTQNLVDGTKAYKLKHGIKDDELDPRIQYPYIKTKELRRQIGNLQKKYTTLGYVEAPISQHIVHDMWSAFLYAARFVQRIEREEMYANNQRDNEWEKYARSNAWQTSQMRGGRQRFNSRLGKLAIK